MRMFQVCVCGEPLQCNEGPTPEPKGTEVLLKTLAAGVCHSDLHLVDGWFDLGGGKRMSLADRGMKIPVTLGHENVGQVVALGPDARGVKVGDRVLADPWIGCGTCEPCPGTARTRMVEEWIGVDPALEEQVNALHPIGRIAEPEEIAAAAIWLCSDDASFMCGHAMSVDGGYVIQ